MQSGAEILERATEGETVIEQRDVLERSGVVKVEGDRNSDQGSSQREGRVEQIMQGGGQSHKEDSSSGGSVKNVNFSPMIILALLVQAVL